MLAVERWAQNKPPIIALLAPQIAGFARELPEIYQNLKKHQLANHKATLPHLPSWYVLYKNHRRYCEPFQRMLRESSELFKHFASFGVAVNELSRNKEEFANNRLTESDIVEGHQFWNKGLALSFDDLRSDFESHDLDQNAAATVSRYLQEHQMELSFVFLVFTPCITLYKTTPGRLYHKARLGDVSAIDKLLRLDPLMLHDPGIGQKIQKIRLFGRQTTYQNLIESPMKPIKAKVTNGKIKASMATLISLIAETINQPLTSTEIKKLFDAVAQDADKRDIDSSLPDSPEAFYKSIQRKRPSWQQLLNPDRKKSK